MCYGKYVGEHNGNLGNISGTQPKLIGNFLRAHSENILGAHWEPVNFFKKNPSPPNLKGKNARDLEHMLGASHWLHEISLPKRVHHHFCPGLLLPLAKNTLPINQEFDGALGPIIPKRI